MRLLVVLVLAGCEGGDSGSPDAEAAALTWLVPTTSEPLHLEMPVDRRDCTEPYTLPGAGVVYTNAAEVEISVGVEDGDWFRDLRGGTVMPGERITVGLDVVLPCEGGSLPDAQDHTEALPATAFEIGNQGNAQEGALSVTFRLAYVEP